jgi:hypothetical protein
VTHGLPLLVQGWLFTLKETVERQRLFPLQVIVGARRD